MAIFQDDDVFVVEPFSHLPSSLAIGYRFFFAVIIQNTAAKVDLQRSKGVLVDRISAYFVKWMLEAH